MSTPSEQEWEGATLDVEALRPKPCGCCDGGLLMACTCRDYRNDLDRALDEVERLRTQIERERKQARQEALTEAMNIAAEMGSTSGYEPGHPFAEGWKAGLTATEVVLKVALRGAAGGVL